MTSAVSGVRPLSSDLHTIDELIDADFVHRVVVDDYSHALEEHPNSAPIVRQCFENKGPMVTFVVYKNERWLQVCKIDAKTFGFRLVDKVGKEYKELTAYIKDNFKCDADVWNYQRIRNLIKFNGSL